MIHERARTVRGRTVGLLLLAATFGTAVSWEGATAQAAVEHPLLVTSEWLAERRDDPEVLLLNVEYQDSTYLEEHIPAARFLRYGDIATQVGDLLMELPPLEQVVNALEEAGVSNDLHIVLYGPGYALLDGRPDNEYTGADGGRNGTYRPGHIPGAGHVYWEEFIVSRQEDPSFVPREEMEALFRRAGIDPGETVVSYCYIGMRASVNYFVSRLLGYETRFYDGSWNDWSLRGLPAETGPQPPPR